MRKLRRPWRLSKFPWKLRRHHESRTSHGLMACVRKEATPPPPLPVRSIEPNEHGMKWWREASWLLEIRAASDFIIRGRRGVLS